MSALQGLLIGGHALLASATGEPIWEMTDDEAARLCGATAAVARHYSIKGNQKVIDWAALGVAVGSVYGTRLYALRMQASAASQPAPAPVFTLHENGA